MARSTAEGDKDKKNIERERNVIKNKM